jgi:hypothetical protein
MASVMHCQRSNLVESLTWRVKQVTLDLDPRMKQKKGTEPGELANDIEHLFAYRRDPR